MSVSAIQSASSAATPLDPHDPVLVRRTAAQMVSELFFKPLLAEMRASPFGGEIGGGGRGEEVFGERLDELLADAAANADQGGLVTQIAKYLSPESAQMPQAEAQVEAEQPKSTRTWPGVCWSTLKQLQEMAEGQTR
ncbi:MAG: hypothetical protein PVJ57_16620 [Phycisphaerae bacterium]|jgi:hypothetical protein